MQQRIINGSGALPDHEERASEGLTTGDKRRIREDNQDLNAPRTKRRPIVIHTYPPKAIHTDPDNFMCLVQRLTGSAATQARLGTAWRPAPPPPMRCFLQDTWPVQPAQLGTGHRGRGSAPLLSFSASAASRPIRASTASSPRGPLPQMRSWRVNERMKTCNVPCAPIYESFFANPILGNTNYNTRREVEQPGSETDARAVFIFDNLVSPSLQHCPAGSTAGGGGGAGADATVDATLFRDFEEVLGL